MSKFFKKIDGSAQHHAMVSNESVALFKGVKVFVCGDYATIDNLYSFADGYTESTEEEFISAFDKAIAMISSMVPVLA